MTDELQKLLIEAQDDWGRNTVKAVLEKLRSYPIKWKGILDKSISYEQNEASGEIDFFMADYGRFVDEGVDGLTQKWGSPFRFRGNILGTAYYIKPWADAKGLNNFAVAHSIQKKGIKPRPFFDSVITSKIPELESVIDATVKDYLDKTL